MFFHPIKRAMITQNPRSSDHIRCLDNPLTEQFTGLKACHTREAMADVVFSTFIWCPANASRKVPGKNTTLALWRSGSKSLCGLVLKHQS